MYKQTNYAVRQMYNRLLATHTGRQTAEGDRERGHNNNKQTIYININTNRVCVCVCTGWYGVAYVLYRSSKTFLSLFVCVCVFLIHISTSIYMIL